MTYLLWGKILETIGAALLAWVAIRAWVIEISIGRHLNQDASGGTDLESLRKGLKTVLERRKQQFGICEASLVALGTVSIAFGCGLYLVGLLIE